MKNKTKWDDNFFKSNELNEETGNLEKSKQVWVPPSGKKKGYYRTDSRTKKEKEKGSGSKSGGMVEVNGFKFKKEKGKLVTGDHKAMKSFMSAKEKKIYEKDNKLPSHIEVRNEWSWKITPKEDKASKGNINPKTGMEYIGGSKETNDLFSKKTDIYHKIIRIIPSGKKHDAIRAKLDKAQKKVIKDTTIDNMKEALSKFRSIANEAGSPPRIRRMIDKIIGK